MSYSAVPPPSYSPGESSKRFDQSGKLLPRQKYVVPRYPKNKPFCPPIIPSEVSTFNPEEQLSIVEVEEQSRNKESTLASTSRDTEQTIENENLQNDNIVSRKSISDEQTSSSERGFNNCSPYSYDQEGFFVSNNEEKFAVVVKNASDEESQPAECGHIGEEENGMEQLEHERNEREKKIKCIKSLCSLIIFVFIFIVFMWLKF